MNLTKEARAGIAMAAGMAGAATPSDDPRLIKALEEYRALLDAGLKPDREEFQTRHADIWEALADCLDGLDFIHRAAPQLDEPPQVPAALVPDNDIHPEAPLGDYRIVREIGRGGMGVVYEAVQISLGRRVALKVLPFAAALDAKQLQRFKNEAQAAASLHHTNIVPVFGIGCERAVHFYAMQFIDGQTLANMIADLRARGEGREARGEQQSDSLAPHLSPLAPPVDSPTGPYTPAPFAQSAIANLQSAIPPSTPPAARLSTEHSATNAAFFRTAATLGMQAAEALDHAHQLGVIHRDIKPANLLIDVRGNLWITDFGLAHCQSQAGLTMTGDLVGTLRYMSPEQALAQRIAVDQRTDIYSLGATLYELLTLQPVFGGQDRQELLRQIAFEEPRLPRRINEAIPRDLETIVLKAMAKNPAERYGTAQELANDLDRYLRDEPIRARRPTLVQKARRWARRHRQVVWTAAVGLLVAVTISAASVGWIVRDKAARLGQIARDFDTALAGAHVLQEQQKWPEALAVVKHAQMLLTSDSDEDMRQRVRERIADLEMIVKLEDARLRRTEVKNNHLDWAETDATYAKAFQEYGIDLEALDPKEAGALLRARNIRVELAAALDDWVQVLKRWGKGGWQDRLTAARAADPDLFRNRVREAVARDDGRALTDLAAAKQAADLPAPTLLLLAYHPGLPLEPTVALLRKAQRRRPGDFWINFELGTYLQKLKPAPTEDAIRYLSVAVALRPNTPIAHDNLGAALKMRGRLDDAIVEHREALRLQDNAVSHCCLGTALVAKGRLDDGIAQLREAIRLKKDYADSHLNLGVALKRKGRDWLDEAIGEYREAVKLNENDADAHMNLGNALKAKGMLDDAIAEHRKALSLNKDDSDIHYNLANTLKAKGLLDKAIDEYREAVALNPNEAVYQTNLGNTLYVKGRLDEAMVALREAIRIDPKDATPHGSLGSALYAKGRLAEAIAEFHVAIRLDPNNSEAHNNLGQVLIAKQDWKGAIAALRQAVRLAPKGVIAHNTLAWLLATCPEAKFRDPPGAVQLAEKAVALQSKNGSLWNTLGVAQYRAGNCKGCTEALHKSMALTKGGDGSDWFFLAMAHRQLGNKKEAGTWYDRAVAWQEKNQPQDEELRRFRAEAAALLGVKEKKK